MNRSAQDTAALVIDAINECRCTMDIAKILVEEMPEAFTGAHRLLSYGATADLYEKDGMPISASVFRAAQKRFDELIGPPTPKEYVLLDEQGRVWTNRKRWERRFRSKFDRNVRALLFHNEAAAIEAGQALAGKSWRSIYVAQVVAVFDCNGQKLKGAHDR